ncbi:MAG TPA: ABC transporter substrate-binding protein, partial [Massilibacterium sp.]|nr:ABC transporter substrate-binding protein [Massilibacterium sp.]
MRLISLCPSNTELLAYLDLIPALVGVDDHSSWPKEIHSLKKVGPDLAINIETVKTLKPDLVLASLSVPGMEKNIEQLQKENIPHLILNPQSGRRLMGIVTLRPNGTLFEQGWVRTGGSTVHGVLADDSNSTYLTENTGFDTFLELAMSGYTLAAGERVKRVRARIRMASVDSTNAQLWVRPVYDGDLGEDYFASVTGTSPANRSGPWISSIWNTGNQQTIINGLEWHATFAVQTARAYEAYIDLDVWERTDAPTVASPSGTITDTDLPTIESYTANLNDGSPSLWSRQVRVFRDAVYGAGGFDP